MTKHLIREDELGLYVQGGGYVSRPETETLGHPSTVSRHKAGDKVNFSHSGGPATSVGGEMWWIVSETDPRLREYNVKQGLTKCQNCGKLRAHHKPAFKHWIEDGCDNPVYP